MRVMRIKYSWLMKRRAMFCTDIKKKKEKEIRSNFTDVRREKGEISLLIRVACTFDESRDKDVRKYFVLFVLCEAEERRISLSFSPFEREKTPDRIRARVCVLFSPYFLSTSNFE